MMMDSVEGNRIENALLVMLLDPHIRAYLDATDPKAVEQAKRALKLEAKTPKGKEVGGA